MNKFICSRFDSKIPDSEISKRLLPFNQKFKQSRTKFSCISTNGEKIFDGEKYYSLDQFFDTAKLQDLTYLVLTDKEQLLLARWVNFFKLTLVSFERNFPLFDAIKYHSSLDINFSVLEKHLITVKRFGLNGNSISSSYLPKTTKILNRKISQKTNLDKCFAHAYLPPYQEVFRFIEQRPQRSIIALDFNSMFSFCMAGKFLKPDEISFENVNSLYCGHDLAPGLYRVVLIRPKSNFFASYHPFKYSQLDLSLHFKAEKCSEIEVQLYAFELESYAKYFEQVFIKSALISESEVGHPLYSESKRLYRLRKKAKGRGNKPLERLYKFQLAMLHSCTNKRVFKKKLFESQFELLKFIQFEFGLNNSDALTFYNNPILRLKVFDIEKYGDGFVLNYINLRGSQTVYSFSSQVLARARLVVFDTIEKFLDFDGLNICYVNTDSIHVSIPMQSHDLFMSKFRQLIGDNIGQLKVQAIADEGVWFDLGHYYLMKGNQVIYFANASLNHKGNTNPFIDYRERLRSFRNNLFPHLVTEKVTFLSILSHKKKLKFRDYETHSVVNYKRFEMTEIRSYEAAREKLGQEEMQSIQFKKDSYSRLRYR